jgi:glycosyltransferase involved in cell wall biosynthesis
MAELISVIITCHNLDRYIGSAIESVLNQDYHGLIEVVVVDDCSTDKSAEIIKTYENIHYIRPEKNLGVLMATVLALESTSGELIFFLDGDDIWESSKLSVLIRRFKADPQLAFVTHDLRYIDSNGHLLDRKSRPEAIMTGTFSCREDSMIRDGVLMHNDYVWLGSAYAIHRKLGDVSGFCNFVKTLPDPFNTYQDWPLAFWLACQPQVCFGYVSDKLFRYRLHGANHSGDASNVSKALRNFGRSRNTMEAISIIAAFFDVDARIKNENQKKLNFYSYLVDLYSNSRWRATKGFLISFPYFISNKSSFPKEIFRFIGVQFLGVERFIRVTRLKSMVVNG